MDASLIKIRIRSFFSPGFLDHSDLQTASGEDFLLEIKYGTTVESLFQKIPSLGLGGPHFDMIIVFVNGTLKGMNYVLEDEDILDFHLPVSGG